QVVRGDKGELLQFAIRSPQFLDLARQFALRGSACAAEAHLLRLKPGVQLLRTLSCMPRQLASVVLHFPHCRIRTGFVSSRRRRRSVRCFLTAMVAALFSSRTVCSVDIVTLWSNHEVCWDNQARIPTRSVTIGVWGGGFNDCAHGSWLGD